jgi:hypothetical protein
LKGEILQKRFITAPKLKNEEKSNGVISTPQTCYITFNKNQKKLTEVENN